MKKLILTISVFVVALLGVFAFGCGKSEAPVVGNYKLVSVVGSNNVNSFNYKADGSDPLITENSFTLEMKSNYEWVMNIVLPGVDDHEDGDWEDNNGAYSLIEDKDEPKVPLTYKDGLLTFNFTEDGYVMAVVLKKV